MILAADVAGYSALMERAEEATYVQFEQLKHEVIEPSLQSQQGRLIKTTGDGALVEFASCAAAVRCAIEIQDRITSTGGPLRLRIGINFGEVIVGPDGELFGDGINIAVRLEGLAIPDSILISAKVYNEIEGKLLDIAFQDLGELELKNISKRIRTYAVRKEHVHSSAKRHISQAKGAKKRRFALRCSAWSFGCVCIIGAVALLLWSLSKPALRIEWVSTDFDVQTNLSPGQRISPISLEARVAGEAASSGKADISYDVRKSCAWVSVSDGKIAGEVPFSLSELLRPCEIHVRAVAIVGGRNTVMSLERVIKLLPKERKIVDLVVGAYHACVLLSTGNVNCWTKRYPTNDVRDDEKVLIPPELKAKSISAGLYQTCAIDASGIVRCWGDMFPSEAVPRDVERVRGGGTVLAGSRNVCLRSQAGGTACWGESGRHQLSFSPLSPIKTFDGRIICELLSGDLRCLEAKSGQRVYRFGAYSGRILEFAEPSDQRVCFLIDDSRAVCAIRNGDTVDITSEFPKGKIDELVDTNEYICARYTSGETTCVYPKAFESMFKGKVAAPTIPNSFRSVRIIAGKFYGICAISDKDRVGCWGISNLDGGLLVPDALKADATH